MTIDPWRMRIKRNGPSVMVISGIIRKLYQPFDQRWARELFGHQRGMRFDPDGKYRFWKNTDEYCHYRPGKRRRGTGRAVAQDRSPGGRAGAAPAGKPAAPTSS
jgi:hypothetical protein